MIARMENKMNSFPEVARRCCPRLWWGMPQGNLLFLHGLGPESLAQLARLHVPQGGDKRMQSNSPSSSRAIHLSWVAPSKRSCSDPPTSTSTSKI